MFGNRYFATRQRLAGVVEEVRELGELCVANVSELDEESESLKELLSPFLVMVCGEVNAGKSTLLNGLFNTNLCKTHILPKTRVVEWFRWGDVPKDVDINATLCERSRPDDFLKNFNFLDTPGTNSAKREHLETTEAFLPEADLLLAVFPVGNPWGAATWDFIAKVKTQEVAKVVFVLQQIDKLEEKDVAVILGHIHTLAFQKLGITPEIFPVSGELACEARMGESINLKLWNKSGFPALESFLAAQISGNSTRRQVLSDVRVSTQNTLRSIEKKVEQDTLRLDQDQYFLRELETEVDARREDRAASFSEKFTGLTDVFMREARGSVKRLRERISISQSFLSLFRTEQLPSQIESLLIESVKDAVEERANLDGQELVRNCRDHWETVEPRIRERLQVPVPDFDKETDSLTETRERFVRRLGRSAKQAVTNLKLRGNLDQQMEARRRVLRRFFSVSLSCTIVAGVLGALGVTFWPFIVLALSALSLMLASLYSEKSKKELCQNFADRIESCRAPFGDSLSNEYQDGIRAFYLEYGGLFENVRRHIAEHKLALKPRLERWNDLFLELKGIEQEI